MITSERFLRALGSPGVPPMRQVASADEYTFALGDSTDKIGLLFDNLTLGIAIADPAFRFLAANPAFLAMLGYSSEELQQFVVSRHMH
jgi:PAS domain-containing protein